MRIRVLIAGIPEMLREILVSQLHGDPDIELLISAEEPELIASIGRSHPDVVIAPCDDPAPPHDQRLLEVYLVGPEAISVRRVELRPVGHDLGNVPLGDLVASIKARKDA